MGLAPVRVRFPPQAMICGSGDRRHFTVFRLCTTRVPPFRFSHVYYRPYAFKNNIPGPIEAAGLYYQRARKAPRRFSLRPHKSFTTWRRNALKGPCRGHHEWNVFFCTVKRRFFLANNVFTGMGQPRPPWLARIPQERRLPLAHVFLHIFRSLSCRNHSGELIKN